MKASWLFCLAMLTSFAVHGENLLQVLMGKDPNQLEWLQANSLSLGGWMSLGGTHALQDSTTSDNFPVTFNNRTGELQLSQVNFFIQKAIDVESPTWDFGGKVDILFGTDSRFTQAGGWDDKLLGDQSLGLYDLAIPQAYLEVFAPFGNGITAKLGHFYTIIGHEVVTAPNNFFYSHSYTMQYGEPFTHTGILLSYALSDDFTLNAGTVSGWDNFSKNASNWNFLGGLSWTNDEATSAVSWSVISGAVDDATDNNRTLSSLVISHSFTDKLQYVFQQDFGFQEQVAMSGATATWYGINQYVFYDFTDTVSAGIRGEWFHDSYGNRLNIGQATDVFALTAGINWQAQEWLKFRPELRYDWAEPAIDLFNNRTKGQQLEVAVDMVIQF